MTIEASETNRFGRSEMFPGVKLKNPTDKPVSFTGKNSLIREVGVPVKRDGEGRITHTATRKMELVIAPGETVAVSHEVANQLVQYWCTECEPNVRWVFGEPGRARCVDWSHRRKLISGLAMMLVPIDDGGHEVAVERDTHLVEPTLPAAISDPEDMHARAMARAARMGGSK
jgi:hypothetical protein